MGLNIFLGIAYRHNPTIVWKHFLLREETNKKMLISIFVAKKEFKAFELLKPWFEFFY